MAKAGGNSTSSDEKLSGSDWRAIAETLPAGADRAFVRAELARIKRDTLSSEEWVRLFEDRARQSDRLAQDVTGEERAQLERDAQRSRELAKHHTRLIGEPRRFRRQCAILLLWQTQGGGDPPKYVGGKAVVYLRAASLAVLGRELSAEGAKYVIEKFRALNFSDVRPSGAGALSVKVLLFDEHGNLVEDDAERIPPGGAVDP